VAGMSRGGNTRILRPTGRFQPCKRSSLAEWMRIIQSINAGAHATAFLPQQSNQT
jgi:hypothetical protein